MEEEVTAKILATKRDGNRASHRRKIFHRAQPPGQKFLHRGVNQNHLGRAAGTHALLYPKCLKIMPRDKHNPLGDLKHTRDRHNLLVI